MKVMASLNSFENLDEEVKELLRNYKHKKATVYEPCTHDNFRECLIGLSEELSLFNINYNFNPYIDTEDNLLVPEAHVKLINAVWTLLHHHKNCKEKSEGLEEQNHILEHTIKQLNVTIDKLKNKSNTDKNEARACVASAQRISDQSDEVHKALAETRSKLKQIIKQKETKEKSLTHEIARLKLENEKLHDKVRNKSASYSSCSEVCDSTLLQLKERERKHRALISQLQTNNQKLLREVIALKEEIILSGLHEFKVEKRK